MILWYCFSSLKNKVSHSIACTLISVLALGFDLGFGKLDDMKHLKKQPDGSVQVPQNTVSIAVHFKTQQSKTKTFLKVRKTWSQKKYCSFICHLSLSSGYLWIVKQIRPLFFHAFEKFSCLFLQIYVDHCNWIFPMYLTLAKKLIYSSPI